MVKLSQAEITKRQQSTAQMQPKIKHLLGFFMIFLFFPQRSFEVRQLRSFNIMESVMKKAAPMKAFPSIKCPEKEREAVKKKIMYPNIPIILLIFAVKLSGFASINSFSLYIMRIAQIEPTIWNTIIHSCEPFWSRQTIAEKQAVAANSNCIQQIQFYNKRSSDTIYYNQEFQLFNRKMTTMNLMLKMTKVNFDCQLYNESIKMSNNYMQIVDKRHNKRTFTQPQTISRHLLCSICSDVFDDPVRTLCGHTFCYICIQNWSLIKTKCPLCNENFQKRKLEKDLLAAALVDDLNVKCFHQGCNWEGVESLRKKHQRTCDFRPRKDIEVVQNAVEVSDYQDVYEVSHFDLTSSPNEP